MNNIIGTSSGFAKKTVVTPEYEFSSYLKEVSHEGDIPFLKYNKFDVLYFTTYEDNDCEIDIAKDTEKYVLSHTLTSEIILKPRNKWVMFSSINWTLVSKFIEKNKINYVSASNTTPVLKKIWQKLDKETLQYFFYLSELEDNLHLVLHPNYQVNHRKRKTLNISQKLLHHNLRFKASSKPNTIIYSDILTTLFKKSKDNCYKMGNYSRNLLMQKSQFQTTKDVEKYILSQKNQYGALKVSKYCSKIKFKQKKSKSKSFEIKMQKRQKSTGITTSRNNLASQKLISLDTFLIQ